MIRNFFHGLDVLCHHQKFVGEIELRAPAVGAKMSRLSFFCLSRSESGSSELQFEQLFCRRLWVDFDSVFNFFGGDCRFRIARQFLFLLVDGAIIFARFQNSKSPKIGENVYAPH